MSIVELLGAAAVAVLIIVLCSLERAKMRRNTETIRANFQLQFRKFRVEASDAMYQFNGEEADIIADQEDGPNDDEEVRLVRIRRYARNRHGEYFLFISNGTEPPFFKHVQHSMAQVVLGDKYLPPSFRNQAFSRNGEPPDSAEWTSHIRQNGKQQL